MKNEFDTHKPRKLNDAEILEAFPQAGSVIPQKLKEYMQQRTGLVTAIQDELISVNANPDEDFRFFWRTWLKLTLGQELVEVDRQLARLDRQLRVMKGVPYKAGQLTADDIEAARNVPIESLFNQPFRRSGKGLVGLCPFHDEKTPSFHIYQADNHAWCFGCNQGGDAIKIAILIHGYSFKEAVRFLAGGKQ